MPSSSPVDSERPTLEPVVVELHHAGGLSRGAARGAWPAVIAEIKKLKPGRAQLFGTAEVDVDHDGETLVVEFPAGQSFSIQLASEPEVRELLQRALASALGYAPPVRYQLGKGVVRKAKPPSGPSSAATPESAGTDPIVDSGASFPPPSEEGDPDPDYYETGAGFSEPSAPYRTADGPSPPEASADPQPDDITRLLTEGLGAQILAERAVASSPTAGSDDEAAAELAEFESAAEAAHKGQALFESDPREDEST